MLLFKTHQILRYFPGTTSDSISIQKIEDVFKSIGVGRNLRKHFLLNKPFLSVKYVALNSHLLHFEMLREMSFNLVSRIADVQIVKAKSRK